MTRTIAVLGPIPRDHVVTHTGQVFDKYGCALYTAAALASLAGPGDRVVPVAHVGPDDLDPILELLAPFPNVDTSCLLVAESGDRIELTYRTESVRDEVQTGAMPPITPEDLEPVLDADAFVCVPITDYEVSEVTLRHLKSHSDGLVVLDGHGPTTTIGYGGRRVRRMWHDRARWLQSVDVLKLNREEAACSWFEGGLTPEEGALLDDAALRAFGEQCLAEGAGSVCVTLDDEGSIVFERDAAGALRVEHVAPVVVEEVIDTTGCGDSFAAGIAWGLVDSGDVVDAARWGNAMGAQRCGGGGLDVYLGRDRTLEQLAATYGATR